MKKILFALSLTVSNLAWSNTADCVSRTEFEELKARIVPVNELRKLVNSIREELFFVIDDKIPQIEKRMETYDEKFKKNEELIKKLAALLNQKIQ